MAKEIAVGTVVTDNTGNEYPYGGENDHGPGWTSYHMSLLERKTVIKCDASEVMPAADVPDLNLKDSRVTVTNRKADKPRSAAGPWFMEIPGYSTWTKTKGEGLKFAAMRLAIADWHNA